jgi:diguanylate cyclase (GGDEF)-like protein
MEVIAALGRFMLSDIQTLVKVLFLGNLLFAFVVAIYASSVAIKRDRRLTMILAAAKLAEGAGWMGVTFIRLLPHVVSINIGQSLIYVGLFLESLVMLEVANDKVRRLKALQFAIFSIVVVLFNLFYALGLDYRFRFAFGAYSVFLIMVIPGIVFLVYAGKSPLRRLLGSLCVLVFITSLGRTLATLDLFTRLSSPYGAILNDLSLLLFVLHMHIGGAALLLILKEDVDRKIADLAFRDPLTGLYNRRHFLEHARSLIARAARSGESVSLLFMDLDHFKGVNDRYGHNFGDEVLRDFAAVLRMHVRTYDLACRYGGEEFVALLSDLDSAGAAAVAERIRNYLKTSKFPNKSGFSYTVSVGIASVVPSVKDQTVDILHALVMKSDAALYRAKGAGRDRVEIAGDEAE